MLQYCVMLLIFFKLILTCIVFLFRVVCGYFFGWLFVFVVLCSRVMACFLVYCCYDDIIVYCTIVVQFIF